MNFGDNLKSLRKAKKLSQESLAEKMNVSRQSVSKWETGEAYPEMNNILELCHIFHCQINDLVNDHLLDLSSLSEEVQINAVKFKEEKQKKIRLISQALYFIARIGRIICYVSFFITIIVMLVTPFFIQNITVKNNQLLWNGNNKNFNITTKEEQTILKYKNFPLLAINSTEVTSKYLPIIKNHPRFLVLIYLEIGYLTLTICLILYKNILNRLENLFININKGDTPFTLENVTYIKEMARLMIISLLLPLIGGVIFEIIFQTDLDVDIELFDVIQILFLFGISYIFEYGYELQQDTKATMYGPSNE